MKSAMSLNSPKWVPEKTMGKNEAMHLAQDINRVATLTGHFTLRSGQVSNTYFDKYRFEADPTLLRSVCTEMAKRIPPDVDVLAGLELGGIPLVTLLSHLTGLPAAFSCAKKPSRMAPAAMQKAQNCLAGGCYSSKTWSQAAVPFWQPPASYEQMASPLIQPCV
jgi:hypothetical protein